MCLFLCVHQSHTFSCSRATISYSAKGTCKAADALQELQVLSQLWGVAALVAMLLVQLALSRACIQLSSLQPKQVPQILHATATTHQRSQVKSVCSIQRHPKDEHCMFRGL